MSQLIPVLWSERDVAAEDALRRSVDDDDLLTALLAVEGADTAQSLAVAGRLLELGARVKMAVDGDPPLSPKAALAQVLGHDLGLGGAGANSRAASLRGPMRTPREAFASSYDAPENSAISHALEHGVGQPIIVSAIWMLVGRLAGIDVTGLPLPGHFIAAVHGEPVDPFARGRAMTPEQCRALAQAAVPGRPFEAQWMEPASTRTIIERVLRNLARGWLLRHRAVEQAEADLVEASTEMDRGDRVNEIGWTPEFVGLYRAIRLLTQIAPDDAPSFIERARMAEVVGAVGDAKHCYKWVAQHSPGTREARIAEMKLLELQDRSRTLH